jgi:hypothetical protein
MRFVAPIVAILLSLTACFSKPPLHPHSCSISMSWRADPAFRQWELDAIRKSLDIWTEGTQGRACFFEGGDTIHFYRVWKQEELCPFDSGCMAHVGLHTAGKIWLVMGEIPTERYAVAVAVHEIGHALRVPHQETGCMQRIVPEMCVVDGKLPKSDFAAFCAVHRCTP